MKLVRFTKTLQNQKKILHFFALLFLIQFLGVECLKGATKTWSGGTGTTLNWTTGSNWGGTAPVAGDDIVFNTIGTITFTTLPGANVAYNSLTINQGTVNLDGGNNRAFTLGGNSGVDFFIANGASFGGTRINITLAANATASINGTLSVSGTNNRTFNTNGTNVATTVSGSIINSGTVTCTTASKLVFSNSSTYQHARDAGNIPTSTWNATSNCNLTGTTATIPTGLNQTFSNFTWNCTSQSANTTLSPTSLSILGNLTINGTGASNLSIAQNLSIGGNVILNAGTFDASTYTYTVAGDWTNNGGAFIPGSGTVIFTGNNSAIHGTVGTQTFNNLTVNKTDGQTLTSLTDITTNNDFSLNSGTFVLNNSTTNVRNLNVNGNYIQSSGIFDFNNVDNGANSYINVSGNFTNTAGIGSVTTNGNGAENGLINLLGVNKSLNVTTTGAMIWTKIIVPISGSIQMLSNLSLYGDSSDPKYYGSFTVNGSLNMGTYIITDSDGTTNSSAGTMFYLNSGGSILTANTDGLTSNGANGSIQVTGIRTYNSAANYTYNGSTNQTIGNGLSTANNLTINNTSGIVTASGTLTVNGTLTTTNGGTLNMGTNQLLGTLSSITNDGTIQTQNTSATPIPTGRTWGGTILYNGATGQTIPASTFNNLTVNNSSGVTLAANSTVNNLLTLTAGRLTIGANNLTLGVDALAVAGTLNASNMIVATSTGQVRKQINKNESYLLPIGDATGTAEYSPITVGFTSGTYAGGAYYGTNVTNTKHPSNTTITNFLNRYWTVTQSGITSFIASVTGTYLNADITGSETGQAASRYTGSIWVKYGALGSNNLSATSLTSFGDFTGLNNTPTISATPTSLTTFTYPFNNGPSNILSFTVSGTDLVENVIISPSASFEVSATGGAGFTASPSVSLPPTGGSISSLPVYVRMKSGLSTGAVASQNIIVSTSGATSVNVSCSGTVSNQPVITVSPASSTLFSYTFALGPSTEQTFNISGSNLYSNVTITAPANYEISLTSGANFVTTTLTIPITSGSLILGTGTFTNVPIYVRLKSGLGTGNFNENVVASATYAANQTIVCTGTVSPKATLTTSTSWLASFIYSGAGPSASQTFQLNGTNLGTNNVTITPPTDFELSPNGSTWYTTSFTISPTGGSVNQLMYARLRASRAVGNYGPQNVTLTAQGAVVKTVAFNGSVVNSATILTSKTTLTGFGYLFGSGPSTEQFVTVSGASLTNNITITPPANFEVLNPSTGTYQSTAITLTRSGTTVAAINIGIRLKAGIVAADHTGNLNIASSGATSKTVALTGKVYATPLITSTGGGNYCIGETINLTSSGTDVQSRFWTGPNSYYSTLVNPSITNATTAMSGDYIVTGNVEVGGNLIYNGDFELGNTGVGSSYSYVAPTTDALIPEDLYTVVALASTVHGNFNSNPDHTLAPGTLQMVINGNRTAGVVVWSQSVSVVNNANYEFTYWLQTVVNGTDPAPAKLQLYVNGVMAGPIYTANPTSGVWTKYLYNTNAGSNNILNLELINQTTVANGNDFALDDISFKQILSATSTQSVVVSPSVVPSVTVTHSPSTVYQNTPVVFTANPINGGLTPTYKWFVGGVEQIGQTASTFNLTPTSTGNVTVTCEMTSSIVCAAPKPATGNDIINVQAPLVNYWMGYIDIDWGKPANWTAGFVPATGDNVIYATVANFGTAAIRDLQLDKNRTIGSLINATIRRLLIPAGLTLSCNNTINVTPPVTVPVTNPEDLVYIYASTSLPNGSIIYRNTQSLPAYGTVEMYSPASWDLSRPINQKYNWQFFGIPVTAVDALPTFYGAYVRELIESDNDTSTHWRMLTNTSVLVPFKGYELCQQNANTLYTFKGQLVNRNFESGQFVKTTTGNPLYPGQHLFANPYTAALDINLIDFGNGVEKTAYLYATGTFVQWRTNKLKTDGAIPGQYFAIPRGQAGEFGIPRQVPSMGTLMVRVPKANATTELSYVNFAYNTVAMGNLERQRVKAATIADNQTTTVVDVEGENAADRMWLMSNEGFTRGFDNGFDGIKLKGSALNPQLYAVEKDGEYQVNSVDDLNNTTLAFQAGQDTEYKIKFTHNDNTALKYNKILLHDLIENRIVDITSSGTEYTFNATSASSSVLRFKIITQTNNIETMKLNVSKTYYYNNQLYVQNFSNISGKVYVYDISGRTVAMKSISANENIQIATPKSNVYIVKIAIGESTETVKLFLK